MSELTDRQQANRRLVESLIVLWDEVPDQRFGQLILNLTRDHRGSFEDPWEWKHGEWSARIQAAYNSWGMPSA